MNPVALLRARVEALNGVIEILVQRQVEDFARALVALDETTISPDDIDADREIKRREIISTSNQFLILRHTLRYQFLPQWRVVCRLTAQGRWSHLTRDLHLLHPA